MLTHNELPEEPVTLRVHGAEGHEHAVTLARRHGGGVRLSCSCAMFAREAWCRHTIDVLCMRLRALGVVDETQDLAVESVVMGTATEDLAHEVDRALIAYERALARFEQSRSTLLFTDVLDTIGALARQVADGASTLGDALLRFKRALESAEEGDAP